MTKEELIAKTFEGVFEHAYPTLLASLQKVFEGITEIEVITGRKIIVSLESNDDNASRIGDMI